MFTYAVPETHAPLIRRGAFVRIPFRSKHVWGIVWNVPSKLPSPARRIRSLQSVRSDAALTERELHAMTQTASLSRMSPATVAYLVLPTPPIVLRSLVPHPQTILPSHADARSPQWVVKFLSHRSAIAVHHTYHDRIAAAIAVAEEVVRRRKQSLLIITPQRAWIPELASLLSSMAPVHHIDRTIGRRAQWHAFVASRSVPCIILGTRPAAFNAPELLGAIIIDHAESDDHQQYDAQPHYDARTITALHDIPRLLLSVAPRAEDWATADHRVQLGNRVTPPAAIVDLARFWRGGGCGFLTPELLDAIRASHQRRALAVVLHNRRGRMARVRCHDCGNTITCSTCRAPLAEDGAGLHCRRCAFTGALPLTCPTCASPHIAGSGMGTVRVAALLGAAFPSAEITRIDRDVPRIPDLDRIDILVGSERFFTAIAPRCTVPIGVVCILHAERFARGDDYRANERLLSALRTTAQWAERWHATCVIQTSDPDASAIRAFGSGDLTAFYRAELAEREALGYPPAIRLIRCTTNDPDVVPETITRLQEWQQRGTLRSFEGPETLCTALQTTTVLILKCPPHISSASLQELMHSLPASWMIDADPVRLQ